MRTLLLALFVLLLSAEGSAQKKPNNAPEPTVAQTDTVVQRDYVLELINRNIAALQQEIQQRQQDHQRLIQQRQQELQQLQGVHLGFSIVRDSMVTVPKSIITAAPSSR
jgi:hypothetical protein